MEKTHEWLLACANVTTSLDVRASFQGCSDYPDRWDFPFRLEGGDWYPNITSVELEGYQFDGLEWYALQPPTWENIDVFDRWLERPRLPTSWKDLFSGSLIERVKTWYEAGKPWRWYRLRNKMSLERKNMPNLQLWMEAMDWTQLQSLELMDGVEEYFFEVATSSLTGLKHLTVSSDCTWSCNAPRVVKLIENIPGKLENITWVGGWSYEGLEKILDRYGQTLRRLQIWEQEGGYSPSILSRRHIETIGKKVSELQHIALNIDRNGSWPWKILESLAESLPFLQSVDLPMEIASDCIRGSSEWYDYAPGKYSTDCGDNRFREPLLNETTATQVFQFMQGKRRSGHELQRVDFHVGDWTRLWDGSIYVASCVEGRNGKVECSVLRDDGTAKESGDKVCVQTVKNSMTWRESLRGEGVDEEADLEHPEIDGDMEGYVGDL